MQKHYLAYDAALILVVIVLLLLVASRIIVARTQRHSESARVTGNGRIFGRFRRRAPSSGLAGGPRRGRPRQSGPGLGATWSDLASRAHLRWRRRPATGPGHVGEKRTDR